MFFFFRPGSNKRGADELSSSKPAHDSAEDGGMGMDNLVARNASISNTAAVECEGASSEVDDSSKTEDNELQHAAKRARVDEPNFADPGTPEVESTGGFFRALSSCSIQ